MPLGRSSAVPRRGATYKRRAGEISRAGADASIQNPVPEFSHLDGGGEHDQGHALLEVRIGPGVVGIAALVVPDRDDQNVCGRADLIVVVHAGSPGWMKRFDDQ